MIRLAVLAGLLESLVELSPAAQALAVLGLLGLAAGVIFGPSEQPLKRALKLIAALRTSRRP